jgi:hypothetical protein
MSNLAIHEREAARFRNLIAEERARHEKAMGGLRHELAIAEENARVCIANIDDAKVLFAEHIVYASGTYAKAGEDRVAEMEGAIADLLNGCKHLRTQFFGTKAYAHWHGQSSRHSYGYGPKHGSMIFQIGIQKPVRDRASDPLLSDEEIDAAVYYLRNLERIQAAKAEARAVALAA